MLFLAIIDRSTWRVALRFFAERRPTRWSFYNVLSDRAAKRAQFRNGRWTNPFDKGAHVALFLLSEWEVYLFSRDKEYGTPPTVKARLLDANTAQYQSEDYPAEDDEEELDNYASYCPFCERASCCCEDQAGEYLPY
jgi:hypothetical protein